MTASSATLWMVRVLLGISPKKVLQLYLCQIFQTHHVILEDMDLIVVVFVLLHVKRDQTIREFVTSSQVIVMIA
jgi:hypothetical protein